MSALTISETPVSQRGRVARLRTSLAGRIATVAALVIGVVAGGVGPASATTPDPATDLTGGAGDTFFSSITSYFTGHVLISVLALFALTIGAGVLMGWGRKAAKSK